MNRSILTLLIIGPLACGDEVAPDGSSNEGSEPNDGSGRIETVQRDDSTFATQVDAQDREAWVYFDLDEPAEVAVTDPGDSMTWDLAFRRSNIKVNGGYSGPADVAVAALPETEFEAVERTPVASFEADAPTSGEVDPDRPSFIDDDGTDFVFGRANAASTNGWFDYDPINHVLSPADVTFVVRSTEGAYFKLGFLDYYSQAGSSGFPTFAWAEIAPPPGPRTFAVDASGREAFVYVSLESATDVTVAEPATSSDWDLAFRRTLVRTNGGISGPGWGGAKDLGTADFVAVDRADTVGFAVDALVPPPGPPVPEEQWEPANETLSAWFDYDPETRTVTPRATVFVARDAEGRKHKLRILDWSDGQFELEVQPVPPKPDLRSVTIDAPADAWTYFNARLGEVVEPEVPGESTDWDLALRGSEIRLNGGTSGPGEAAARSVEAGSIDEVVRVPDDGWVADAGGTNEALMSRTDESLFVIRLADGTFAKLRVARAENEQWELEYAYAGPGRRSFR